MILANLSTQNKANLASFNMATTPMQSTEDTNPSSTVYLGTGGYSDTDMVGTLYPKNTKKQDFLEIYAKNYGAVEVNSTFYAPIGRKAFSGMLNKSDARIKFAVKLHQNFSHARSVSQEHAQSFINALQPIIEADCLAALLLQFPHGFDRTINNRLYLSKLTDWFHDYPLAIEFRHSSWHTAQVEHSFRERGLIWCSVDYPKVKGLPKSKLLFTQSSKPSGYSTHTHKRIGYLRLHGNNLNWWHVNSASERHDYRYTPAEMKQWAQTIHHQRQYFDELYIFF